MIRQEAMRKLLIALLGGVWAIAVPTSFAAEPQAQTQVATVFILEGPPLQSFVPYFDRITAIYEKYGVNVERELWTTSFAGSETGRWVIVVTYPTVEDFAKSGTVVNSPEYQAAQAEVFPKFKLLSSSLQYRAR